MLRKAIFLTVALCAAVANAGGVRDIPYAPENGKFGLGDLYLPEKVSPETPVVLTIHGGGWSAGPAAWCIAHILGLEALDAGGKTVRVRPFLGDLDWAEGALPTAQGVVRVRHVKRPDGTVDTKIDAPTGITIVR